MTEQPDPNAKRPEAPAEARGVVDPAWEAALERGREGAEGVDAAGSLEPELAALHLLRHLREPEEMSATELDATWSQIDAALGEARRPFWRQAWFQLLLPIGAAAALVVVVVRNPAPDAGAEPALAMAEKSAQMDEAPNAAAPAAPPVAAEAPLEEELAKSADAEAEPESTAAVLERQFSILEPRARAEVGARVDSQRGSMRAALIQQARGGGR